MARVAVERVTSDPVVSGTPQGDVVILEGASLLTLVNGERWLP